MVWFFRIVWLGWVIRIIWIFRVIGVFRGKRRNGIWRFVRIGWNVWSFWVFNVEDNNGYLYFVIYSVNGKCSKIDNFMDMVDSFLR